MDPAICATDLPRYWNGVRKITQSCQQEFTLGAFDTETFFGKVFATGFAFPDGSVRILHGLRKDHLKFVLDCIFEIHDGGRATTVISAHNLSFDLGVLLWEIVNPKNSTADRAPRSLSFGLLSHRCDVEVFWGRPCFARIRKDKRTIYLIDSWAYFTMSLAKALKMIGAEVQKEEKPKDLGERLIPLRELRPYLEADVRGHLALLREIERLHKKYETRLCVSLPQLSARIFRRFYLERDFQVPTKPLIAAALLSYHGGKNSPPPKAGWFDDCYDLDINSAYPEAMAQLPDFENGRWRLGAGMEFFKRHEHGIFKVRGSLSKCRWGSIFSHDFKRIVGEIDVWTTGYEIREALRAGELRIRQISGYGWEPGIRKRRKAADPRSVYASAFAHFVADFYKLRSETKDPALKYFYKLILNSLYGKFIQRTLEDDGRRVAGSMFDPSIASLITGFVRAKIHRLEHKYRSIHTATDGFITQRKPDPKDCGSQIGKLKFEWDYPGGKKGPAFGRALILRNKLYLFYDQDGNLKKCGLHGFQGKPAELEALWRSGRRTYHISRLVKWAEAWHVRIPPGKAVKGIPRTLHLTK